MIVCKVALFGIGLTKVWQPKKRVKNIGNLVAILRMSSWEKMCRAMIIFVLMAFLGPLFGVSGYLWLSQHPETVAAIMLFASGGIIYSIFQDIAPQVKLENHWAPPMGALLGFSLGLFGLMITTH